MAKPEFLNINPLPHSTGILPNALVSIDALDVDSDLRLDTLKILIEGETAFYGGVFYPPYNGTSSSLLSISLGVRDGYRVIIDNNTTYTDVVNFEIEGYDSYGNFNSKKWSFLIGTKQLNTLYYSDSYGVKKIYIKDLVGESQDKVRTIFDAYSIQPIPDNLVSNISGQFVGNDFYLTVSHDGYGVPHSAWGLTTIGLGIWGGRRGTSSTGLGVAVIKNEIDVEVFSEGYRVLSSQLNNDGTLYTINVDKNRIDVYYGADVRPSRIRPPDFWYDENSTPPIMDGQILGIYLVPEKSSVCSGASRLYVATTKGATRIETCDLEDSANDGYSAGIDNQGISYTYSIVGKTGPDINRHFAILGGIAERVVSVHSDEDFNVFLVATDDGYGNGGLTQVSISGNRQISFLSEGLGTLPNMSDGIVRDSNPSHIRDVFGKKL